MRHEPLAGRKRRPQGGALRSGVLALALGAVLPATAGAAAEAAGEVAGAGRAAGNDAPIGPLAQFQLPAPGDGPGRRGGPPRPVMQFLKYQYAFGSESDATYRRQPDLDRRLRDNSLIAAPQLNGYVLYRPNDGVETLVEMILEQEIAVQEEGVVTLPNGERRPAPKHRASFVVDQAYVRFKSLGPFDLSIGRRNFEDERHWLYDTSLDTAHVRLRPGLFQVEASFSRKEWLDLDLLRTVKEPRIDNYMLYADYRGVPDIKLAAYAIYRDDRSRQEGRPLHLGVRAYGSPSDRFSFWGEYSLLRGKDEDRRRFSGRGFDVGAIYRFLDLPLYPSISLGYAFGSGDGNPDDSRNREFRQTGLQSNEVKAAGAAKFKYYGEVLDLELSNVHVLSAGFGFRPAPSIYVDLAYHRYRLDKVADEIRNWALTARMNQVEGRTSKEVGEAFDVVVGLRNLFGQRRLGLDFRAGWFFPGKAFLRNAGDEENPDIRRADKSVFMLAKFWW